MCYNVNIGWVASYEHLYAYYLAAESVSLCTKGLTSPAADVLSP